MKIGLYGGTFDPPHKGHLKLAHEFYLESNSDLLIIMPSFIPPHKENSKTQACARYEMTKLAFDCFSEMGVNYIVSDYEITKKDVSFTIETVEFLLDKYPDSTLNLCVGSDMLYCFEKWRNADILMKKCTLYSKARVDGEYDKLCSHAKYLEEKYNANVHIMSGTVLDVSSTELRNREKAELLDKKVTEYIEKNGLYR